MVGKETNKYQCRINIDYSLHCGQSDIRKQHKQANNHNGCGEKNKQMAAVLSYKAMLKRNEKWYDECQGVPKCGLSGFIKSNYDINIRCCKYSS